MRTEPPEYWEVRNYPKCSYLGLFGLYLHLLNIHQSSLQESQSSEVNQNTQNLRNCLLSFTENIHRIIIYYCHLMMWGFCWRKIISSFTADTLYLIMGWIWLEGRKENQHIFCQFVLFILGRAVEIVLENVKRNNKNSSKVIIRPEIRMCAPRNNFRCGAVQYTVHL